jgi:hypothetical protein
MCSATLMSESPNLLQFYLSDSLAAYDYVTFARLITSMSCRKRPKLRRV